MAGTNTVGEAIDIVKKRSDMRVVDDVGWSFTAANSAMSLMWNAYPWDDSIKDFPPFFLVPNQPYQQAPYIEIPSDFGQIHSMDVWTLYGQRYPLHIRKRLKPTLFSGDPDQISWLPEKGGFIVTPTPSEAWAAPESQVVGTYKTLPPQITENNINSGTLPFADKHYHVFLEALAWAYAKYSGNTQAAGGSIWQDGRVVRTGLLGGFYDALGESVYYENQGRGYDEIAPAEALIERSW